MYCGWMNGIGYRVVDGFIELGYTFSSKYGRPTRLIVNTQLICVHCHQLINQSINQSVSQSTRLLLAHINQLSPERARDDDGGPPRQRVARLLQN